MRIIALAPYSKKMIKALEGVKRIAIGEVIVIGKKQTFIQMCKNEGFDPSQLTIYDYETESIIVEKCREIYKSNDLILCGELSLFYQRKIFKLSDKEDFTNINIIDYPDIAHLLFVSNCAYKQTFDFDDKKKTIIEASRFMESMGIKRTNVAFLSSENTKADKLEASIIRMILNDSNYRFINIYDSYQLIDLFNEGSCKIINRHNINLLLLKNQDVSKMFVEALNALTKAKIGSLVVYKNQYMINIETHKDEESILFSLLIASRLMEKPKITCTKKQIMV